MNKQFSFAIGDKSLEINLDEKVFEIELKKMIPEVIDSRDFTLVQAAQYDDEATAVYAWGWKEKDIQVKYIIGWQKMNCCPEQKLFTNTVVQLSV